MTDLDNLQTLWSYMHLDIPPEKADCIIGFGCYNEDIPRECARLYKEGFAPYVLFSGGLGRNTESMWTISEAEHFADIAIAEGLPENVIILESKSTNTAENILFTKKLIDEKIPGAKKLLGVHKPYMQRRIFSAFPIYWPGIDFSVTSWRQSVEEYIKTAEKRGRTEKETISMVVGDVQRMKAYAEKGYQTYNDIPDNVRTAYNSLVEMGYTDQLIKDYPKYL